MIQVILGPPGTGKTTALLNLVEEELSRGVSPDRISYNTFTRRGADEAITRACKKFKLDRKQFPHFRTLHSLCYRAIGLSSSDVMNWDRLKQFGDWIGVKISGKFNDDGTFGGYELGDRILFMENLARARMVSLRELYDQSDDDLPWQIVERVSRGYRQYKQANALLDFTDMLTEFLNSNINLRLEVVFNDEAQDQSLLQWAVVRKLMTGARRVCIAGDDDQAIFQWAGADPATLIDMPGQITVLGQSFRVPRLVQQQAFKIIDAVEHRRPKGWAPRDETGHVSGHMDISHVDLSKGQILVLARNQYIIREQIEPVLKAAGIIYECNGKSSVDRGVLSAIVNWEALRKGDSITTEAAREMYEYMSSGVGVARGFKTLKQIPDDAEIDLEVLVNQGGLLANGVWHEALDRIPPADQTYIIEARKRGEKVLAEPRVKVSTIHGAKGGEADHVVLCKEMAKRSYREMELDEDAERRVWYVGVTRARQKLSILESLTEQACPWV